MKIPKARTYQRFWSVVNTLTCWRSYTLQCTGHAGALSWIPVGFPHAESGYYRSGIQRQYCVRFRNHKGHCMSMITDRGVRVVQGIFFVPENIDKNGKVTR